MKKQIKIILLFLLASITIISINAYAEGNLADQKPIEMVLEMNEFKFIPNHLTFETGKTYKLILWNKGKVKHELDSEALKNLAYTRKIEVNDNKGNLIAEVKGSPTEVEVGPGQKIIWWFVPIQTGIDTAMLCLIEGHLEAGMKGTITFK